VPDCETGRGVDSEEVAKAFLLARLEAKLLLKTKDHYS
jgi:hypothetical protein